MLRSLFGKDRKKRTSDLKPLPLDDGIRGAVVGDQLAIVGLTEGFGDVYRNIERRDSFVVEGINRYESDTGEWFELLGVDGERRLWLEWADEDGLFITATTEKRPMGLSSVGLTESDLIRMDEEHSIDNSFSHGGKRYIYKNSQEVLCYEDDEGDGEGFYLWDFVSEERSRLLSVVKWEGMPFQVFISEIVPHENITVRKGRNPGKGG